MADETTEQAEAPKAEAAEHPTDWEAKYRAAIEHSREWEREAKEAKAKLAEVEAQRERADLAARLSKNSYHSLLPPTASPSSSSRANRPPTGLPMSFNPLLAATQASLRASPRPGRTPSPSRACSSSVAPARDATKAPSSGPWVTSGFNPRAREGRDLNLRGSSRLGMVSIHAPARGATLARHVIGGVVRVSIHAPARGATPDLDLVRFGVDVSIHAPARGATRYLHAHRVGREFQSTRP